MPERAAGLSQAAANSISAGDGPSKAKPTKEKPGKEKGKAGDAASDAAVAEAKAKAKAAKELKKEKRAAAVASRPSGPDEGSKSKPSGVNQPAGGSASGAPHTTTPHSASGSGGLPGPSTSTPIKPHRPPIMTSDSSAAAFTLTQQNLFFSHLPTHKPPNTPQAFETGKLHPLIIRLGVLMSSGTLRGGNARTMAMMIAFREVIRDYNCPDQAVLWKDLPVFLSPMIAWLETCRPKGVGGGNAIRQLKSQINALGESGMELTEQDQKDHLIKWIDEWIRERIALADEVIADHAKEKIKPGDTVVTYARSSLVEHVLLSAWKAMKARDPEDSFSVIVVDSRPLLEGKHLLDSLTSAGLPCTYTLLPLLASALPSSSLVLLGASALHADGALYSRAGTCQVSMLAKEYRVPVVACVETYKFGERVVLDGVASNELGDTDGLCQIPLNKVLQVKANSNLTPLSLMYDLTPPSLITAVCTEIGFIPPKSVPTVLGKASAMV